MKNERSGFAKAILTDKLTNWQTDKLTNWQTDKLTNWQTDNPYVGLYAKGGAAAKEVSEKSQYNSPHSQQRHKTKTKPIKYSKWWHRNLETGHKEQLW
jgi:hypothetical protein